METKEVTVKALRKDGKGFMDTDENWYANKFRNFVGFKVGDMVQATLNDKGFLEEVKVTSKAPDKTPASPSGSKGECHLSIEQVRSNAVDAAIRTCLMIPSGDEPKEYMIEAAKRFEKYFLTGE